jgi:rubrerythrin
MKRLYRAGQLFEAAQLKSMLEAMHIPCFLRNENMMRVAGEVPFDQCWPEVWIVEDEDEERARQVLDEFRHPLRHRGPPWWCPKCGEHHQGQFSHCWNCGTEKPAFP